MSAIPLRKLAALPPPPLGGLLGPVDRVRAALLRAVAPRARSLVVERDVRVAVVGSLLMVSALLSTSLLPIWFLALGPIVWGVPHIVADLRYLVARPGYHRRPWVVAAMLAGILAGGFGYGVRGGLAGAAAALLVARAPWKRRAIGLAVVGALIALAQWAGPLADLVFAHLHNAVAVGLWWAWRPRGSRLHWIPLALFAAGCALILTGAMAPLAAWTGGFVAPWTHLTAATLAWGLAPGPFGPMALRFLLLYAFAQSVHYVVWLRLVPEDDRPSPTPRSFVQSFRALRTDLGSWVLWAAVLTALGLAVWAAFNVGQARNGYIQMAFFHGHPAYEAVEAMIRLAADGRHAIRAILTRHDQSQIDHINDIALLASFQGTERECCRRDIDLQLESLGEAQRARLQFRSFKDERVVLDLVTCGRPDPGRGGLVDPGRHSARSSLPLMWRGASTLADPRTKVTIDDIEFAVPVRIRAGQFTAHEGYYSDHFSMAAIRAGTWSARLLKKPDHLSVGAEWVFRRGTSDTTYRVVALDAGLGIARLDAPGETVTAKVVGNRLALARIALAPETGAKDGLVLAFDGHGGFGLSIEGHQDVVSGRVTVVERSGRSLISLVPLTPVWAIDRAVHVTCSSQGDQLQVVTTIGPAEDHIGV
ncbi:MAG: hypothetical protein ACXWMG_05820 [Candidatus Limnocylindria bacterium]